MENEIMDNINGMRHNFSEIKKRMKLLEKGMDDLNEENEYLKNELNFYKQLFISHPNSAVFNLYQKTKNDKKVWVDPIRDTIEYLESLDQDDEIKKWLEPVKCEK